MGAGVVRAALFAVSILALVASGGAAVAQTALGSVTGQARASVSQPIAVTSTQALDFGVLSPASSDATVTLTPSGAITASSPGVILPGARRTAGGFAVSGAANRTYSVTLPATITLTGPAQSLHIGRLALRYDGAAADGGTGQLDATGQQRFAVGGTLAIPAGQAAGSYSGAYPVTVVYQ